MAYEHRLYIVRRNECRSATGKTTVFGEVIAEYNCSRMPYNFLDLFSVGKKIDFPLLIDPDHETDTDNYGDHCRMMKPSTIVKYLENLMETEENWRDYRRIPPLLGLLKGFDPAQWDKHGETVSSELVVVHYGY